MSNFGGVGMNTNGNGGKLVSMTPITDAQMLRVAPSIFAQEAHDSRSDRYTYIPTIDILNGLRKEGFLPFTVAQSRTRDVSKREFTKHMIRLRRASEMKMGEDCFEIVLVNSHDGTSSYQMMAGIFRLVCSNGLVVGDICDDIRVHHKGNIKDDVIEAAYTILDDSQLVLESKQEMQGVKLLPPERKVFAEAAMQLKYEDEKPFSAEKLLQRRRYEEGDGSLWNTFNTVQENLIKGGIRGYSANGNRIRSREIKGIDQDIKLNKALWTLASEMAKLKV